MIEWLLVGSLIVFFTLLSAFFSASETAFFSLSSTRVKTYQHSLSSNRVKIAQLLQKPRDLLVTVFMMNTLVNILLQNACSTLFEPKDGNLLWKMGIPLIITVFFGEIFPKNIAMQNNIAFSDRFVNWVAFFHTKLRPFRRFTLWVTHPISKVLFFFLRENKTYETDELHHMLDVSLEHGILRSEEKRLICGWMNFKEKSVREIMWPKEDVLYYTLDEPISKLTYLFVDQECTKIPLCKTDLDDVVGVVSAKNFFIHKNEISTPESLKKIAEKPFFVPETTQVSTLLKQLDLANQVIALVVDEYGSVSGIIAREDIVECVIGEIEDKRDGEKLYTPSGENELIASGKMEISQFNEYFSLRLENPYNLVTLGGWITAELGEIPKAGTIVTLHGCIFHILAASKTRVRRVYVRKLKENQ